MTTTHPPRGLQASGRRLWKSIADEYELEQHERILLTEACRTVDCCDRLERTAAEIESASPILVELRQQRLVLAKLITALRLPTGVADDQDVPSPIRARAANKRRVQ